ncbi:NupC/NupG family nucleoside CNT transporter [Nocardioides deserti]|uniref:NupC/NupG family nucleoside CNT transporter n=1 Tax=Nocardioides deserti TaxID=1588644 RepID=A0ABR6UA59_9ACTN|nr:nucleoside transporter C-terminal domain-containing protein [Nocardioides deserti]MBC2961250.1 NupC/NupG family nucleoside CNT transporter [Nocardioides deserti]GGO72191.1 putative transporter YutK [Nocardioides deserti]
MDALRGLLGLAVLVLVAVAFSRHRRGISWRTVGAALTLQVAFAALVLRWGPGERALEWLSDRVAALIGYAEEGTVFVFGPLTEVGEEGETVFALSVLPVIVFLGALVGVLYYLRVVQWTTYVVGGALSWLLRVSKVESLYAGTVVFLGQSEAPLMISPYLRSLRKGQLFTIMAAGFAAAAGSTLVGYSLLGAPLEYLLAATVMNAPAALLMAKIMWPDSTPEGPDDGPLDEPEEGEGELDVRSVRDTESRNVIDALGRGALAGGKIAVTVGALLIAFIALIALANAILGAVGGWFGADGLTFEKILGWALAPLAWLLGVPWSEAVDAGSWIGQKTILNEFVAYADFGPEVDSLSPMTVAVVTFALAGFANFSSIAIQIGTLGSLLPERRAVVAELGLRALLAGSLANLSNAAIAGLVIGIGT